jgi:hypothetical protein
MYLIDDIVYLKPFNNNRFYNQNGIIRDIFEHSSGEMYYDVEVVVEGSSNGTYRVSGVSEDQLEYNGGY